MARSLAALLALAVLAAGCGATSSGGSSDGRLRIVAAENFWGDLARQIGGYRVSVTSLISSPDADPHLFEPGTSSGLAVAKASVVIVNGADYDSFMDRLIAAAPSPSRRVVTVASVLHVTGADANPHFWYDVPALPRVVAAMGDAMAAADPANASAYRRGVTRTVAALRPLSRGVAELKAADAGAPVAYTERVPGYLLSAAGLHVLGSPSFTHAIESGVDPSFTDIAAMRRLLTDHAIKVLLLNEQARTAITDQLADLARSNDIPVVAVTETMPVGQTFESWQLGQIRALTTALAS
jgi:zinc/manganese transport system substrate-binding protein